MKRLSIIFFLTFFSLINCTNNDTADWIEEENSYFYFKRPTDLKIGNLTTDSSNTAWIAGKMELSEKTIEFMLFRDNKYFFPCPCTDYSEKSIKNNGQIRTILNHEMRIMTLQQSIGNTNNYWLDLCIDNKHSFKIFNVKADQIDLLREVLFTIKVK